MSATLRLVLGIIAVLWMVPAWGQSTGESPDPSVGTPGVSCITLVTSAEQPKAKGDRAVFSATEILDLEFRVLLPRKLEGDHLIELKVYTPRGHLYQSITVPFSSQTETSEAPRPRKLKNVPNFPFPLEEQSALPIRYRGRPFGLVTARLPVAGTSITNSSLYGPWSVEAYLDGSALPCCPRRSFSITE